MRHFNTPTSLLPTLPPFSFFLLPLTHFILHFAGQNIKEADPKILRDIKERGRLFKQSTIQHSYPFCWRSGTPLIYKAVPAWFVKVEELAAMVSWMVSEENSFTTGAVFDVSGGRATY